MIIGKEFKFDASHFLPLHPGKCSNLHGHTWTITIELDGLIDLNTYMVMDFYEVSKIMNELMDQYLDHHCLNDTLDNPTCENLCIWLADRLEERKELQKPSLRLHSIKIQEGTGGYACLTK